MGHNDLATESSLVDLPETIEARLQRVWKGQKTGSVGAVTLEFDMRNVPGVSGYGSNDLNDVRLLVSKDGFFNTSSIVSPSFIDNTNNIVQFQQDFSSGTGFYFTIGTADYLSAPLPVELLSFTTQCKSNDILLEWSTASETENDFFTIERSINGKNFYKVHIEKGEGNSTSLTKYRWSDKKLSDDIVYYRLKQTDFNGDFKYYDIKSASCKYLGEFSISPNPFKNTFTINLDKNTTYPIALEVYDFLGKKIYAQEIIANNTTIVLEDSLLPGTYIVNLFNEKTKEVGKLLKVK